MNRADAYCLLKGSRTMPGFVKVSALGDEDGKGSPADPNPPVGRPLRKVVDSKPFPPKEEEEEPTEKARPRR